MLSLDELCSFRLPSFGFESTRRVVEPDDVATLIYTSGTTGPPKCVELTHANLLAQWHRLARECAVRPFGRLVFYLPSAHIADRTIGIYCVNMMGFIGTCCPDPSQLSGSHYAEMATEDHEILAFAKAWTPFGTLPRGRHVHQIRHVLRAIHRKTLGK